MTFFDSFGEVALVFSTIRPFFVPVAVLLVVEPLACVGSTVFFEKYASTLHATVYPVSLVHFTITEDPSTATVGSIVLPVPLEDRSVFVQLPSPAVFFILLPLPVIDAFFLNCRLFPLGG